MFGGARQLDLPPGLEKPIIGIWPRMGAESTPAGGASTGAASTGEGIFFSSGAIGGAVGGETIGAGIGGCITADTGGIDEGGAVVFCIDVAGGAIEETGGG